MDYKSGVIEVAEGVYAWINENCATIFNCINLLTPEPSKIMSSRSFAMRVNTNNVDIRIAMGRIFGSDAKSLNPNIINTISAGRLPSAASDKKPTNLLLAKIKTSKPTIHTNFCNISL